MHRKGTIVVRDMVCNVMSVAQLFSFKLYWQPKSDDTLFICAIISSDGVVNTAQIKHEKISRIS